MQFCAPRARVMSRFTRRSREVECFRYLAAASIAPKFLTRIICEFEIKSGFIGAAPWSRHEHHATYRDICSTCGCDRRFTERHSPGRAVPPNSHPASARPVSFWASISACPLDRCNVARHGFSQHDFCVLGDDTIEIMPVHDIKLERRHGLADMLDLALRQRKKIRIAAHEGKPFPVLRNGQDVSRADNAAPTASPCPVDDRAARKVPAATDQRDAVPKLERVALP